MVRKSDGNAGEGLARGTVNLARLFAFALVVTVLCNGAAAYLKRVGLLQTDAYRLHWSVHCAVHEGAASEWQCQGVAPLEDAAGRIERGHLTVKSTMDHIHDVRPSERWLKWAKDIYWLALITLCAMCVRHASAPTRAEAWRTRLRAEWPAAALAGWVAMGFLVSLGSHGPLVAAAGLRSFLFLGVALAGAWLVPHMRLFAIAAAVILLTQVALLPLEWARGIHMFHAWGPFTLARRAIGTLVHPNSLGVLAVCGWAFARCLDAPARWQAIAAACATLLVFASGSGTGLVCLLAMAVWILSSRLAPRQRIAALVVAGAILLVLAPWLLQGLTGRAEVMDSVAGRLHALLAATRGFSTLQWLLGSGLGVNTNTALSLIEAQASSGSGAGTAMPTDSTVTGLLIQLGIPGVLLFYVLLARAGWRYPKGRLFFAMAAVCSLTTNLTEVFPVNVMLALALAAASSPSREPGSTSAGAHA